VNEENSKIGFLDQLSEKPIKQITNDSTYKPAKKTIRHERFGLF